MSGSVPIALSVVIVNWNSRDFLRKCLDSIRAAAWPFTYEIIVLDAASYDGADKMVAAEYPEVRFFQHDVNCGFAKANNIAAKNANGEYLLLLNPDTEVERTAIQEMVETLKRTRDGGIVGARLLNTDGSVQTSCVQSFPSIMNQILDSDWLRARTPASKLWGTSVLFSASVSPQPVDVISGACMLMKLSVFRAVGGFTERYFMYSEDVDLSLKINRTGLRNFIVPNAVVVHHGGGSTAARKVSKFSSVLMLESRWRYFKLHKSFLYAAFYRAAISLSSIARLAIAWAARLGTSRASERYQDWTGTIQTWGCRLKWALGGEAWARRM